MLLPGVGSTWSDRLPRAAPEAEVFSATRLRLAFQSVGPAGLPPGTQRTAIELLNYGDRVRRKQAGASATVENIRLPDLGGGPVNGSGPGATCSLAHFSTGIPDIEDYVAAPPALQRQLAIGRMIAPWTKWAPIRNLLPRRCTPDRAQSFVRTRNARLGRSHR